jgi:hypothetical protein
MSSTGFSSITAEGAARAERADHRIREMTGMSIYQGGGTGVMMTLGIDVAEKMIALVEARDARACAVCGTTFRAGRRDARCCSPRCRKRASRADVTDKCDMPAATIASTATP